MGIKMKYTENEKMLVDLLKSLQLSVADDMKREEVIYRLNHSKVFQDTANNLQSLSNAKEKKAEHDKQWNDIAVFGLHDDSMRPWELKQHDVKCANKGWWFCRLKCGLHKSDRLDNKTADTFEDWIYFNGKEWDINDYRDFGFYVRDVIKPEGKEDE